MCLSTWKSWLPASFVSLPTCGTCQLSEWLKQTLVYYSIRDIFYIPQLFSYNDNALTANSTNDAFFLVTQNARICVTIILRTAMSWYAVFHFVLWTLQAHTPSTRKSIRHAIWRSYVADPRRSYSDNLSIFTKALHGNMYNGKRRHSSADPPQRVALFFVSNFIRPCVQGPCFITCWELQQRVITRQRTHISIWRNPNLWWFLSSSAIPWHRLCAWVVTNSTGVFYTQNDIISITLVNWDRLTI